MTDFTVTYLSDRKQVLNNLIKLVLKYKFILLVPISLGAYYYIINSTQLYVHQDTILNTIKDKQVILSRNFRVTKNVKPTRLETESTSNTSLNPSFEIESLFDSIDMSELEEIYMAESVKLTHLKAKPLLQKNSYKQSFSIFPSYSKNSKVISANKQTSSILLSPSSEIEPLFDTNDISELEKIYAAENIKLTNLKTTPLLKIEPTTSSLAISPLPSKHDISQNNKVRAVSKQTSSSILISSFESESLFDTNDISELEKIYATENIKLTNLETKPLLKSGSGTSSLSISPLRSKHDISQNNKMIAVSKQTSSSILIPSSVSESLFDAKDIRELEKMYAAENIKLTNLETKPLFKSDPAAPSLSISPPNLKHKNLQHSKVIAASKQTFSNILIPSSEVESLFESIDISELEKTYNGALTSSE